MKLNPTLFLDNKSWSRQSSFNIRLTSFVFLLVTYIFSWCWNVWTMLFKHLYSFLCTLLFIVWPFTVYFIFSLVNKGKTIHMSVLKRICVGRLKFPFKMWTVLRRVKVRETTYYFMFLYLFGFLFFDIILLVHLFSILSHKFPFLFYRLF